ncbi:MAG: homoserine O-acetyltransferase [Saprospiraceae bacterium]|jgi:homoserine O-acetyltransferase/O-succinyltransferase|nr:homoserine O-acetyltransferase [Saprospiraceae bacterium]MDP4820012.1 homoserine O-acetyltransferase [Saprospiraceae bacterium]MDP4997791.1 homoserine O-acetyltransferase [Saprospiraceae bacterium]
MDVVRFEQEFELESGAVLPEITIAYETYGKLSEQRDNVVWVCHALTGNAKAAEWWDGLIGPGQVLDTRQYFVVCANVLGSCYGTTGPDHVNPHTGVLYGKDFPLVTIRDMVKAHEWLRKHLEIDQIHLLIGGSLGGQQALEWAISQPDIARNLCVLASNAKHSAWGIAFNEAQRMAIEADPTFHTNAPESGKEGLEAARAIAMLSYRTYSIYAEKQGETNPDKIDAFRASSYQRYQGNKLQQRFNAYAYMTLSKAMDSHNVGRGRGGLEAALQRVKANTLAISIGSDLLFPAAEQLFIAEHIKGASYANVDSIFGHDGFLTEYGQIAPLLDKWLHHKQSSIARVKNLHLIQSAKHLIVPGTEKF